MSDEQGTEEGVEQASPPAAEVEKPQEPAASAGTENTETAGEDGETGQQPTAAEQRIPKSRFDQVIAERNQLRERLAQIEAKPPAADPKAEEAESDEPPEGMTDGVERLRWYVERMGRKFVERELGMPLAQVSQILKSSGPTAEDYAQRKWQDLCREHGLDPASEDVQQVVLGLTKGAGLEPEAALKKAQAWFGKKDNGAAARPETHGVAPGATRERMIPENAKQAAEMAAKGLRAPKTRIEEILAAGMDRDRKRRQQ